VVRLYEPAIHIRADNGFTGCNLPVQREHNNLKTTEHEDEVTCRMCLFYLKQKEKNGL
jgi:hypothetical protein